MRWNRKSDDIDKLHWLVICVLNATQTISDTNKDLHRRALGCVRLLPQALIRCNFHMTNTHTRTHPTTFPCSWILHEIEQSMLSNHNVPWWAIIMIQALPLSFVIVLIICWCCHDHDAYPDFHGRPKSQQLYIDRYGLNKCILLSTCWHPGGEISCSFPKCLSLESVGLGPLLILMHIRARHRQRLSTPDPFRLDPSCLFWYYTIRQRSAKAMLGFTSHI